MSQQYVVLPAYGFLARSLAQTASLAFGEEMAPQPAGGDFQVIDAIHAEGPRLVEMTAEAELRLRLESPTLKIVPVTHYDTLRQAPEVLQAPKPAVAASGENRVEILIQTADGKPLAGAQVSAFINFRFRTGGTAVSDEQGIARLPILPDTALERLYIYGPPGYWGHYARAVTLANGLRITLAPIDLKSETLALHRFRQALPPNAGEGIIVGIVDSGVDGNHPSLGTVDGGANLVLQEVQNDAATGGDWGPAARNGGHGTHVAGIIGAQATAAVPIRGVAPGARLRSYRVFPHSGGRAANYDIMNAIYRAVRDGCHIVNLSLGGDIDEGVRAAIGWALDQGVIVIAAAGNDGRKPVSFPANLGACIAVAAMGWKGAFPEGSSEDADVVGPYGKTEASAFVAGFSNTGPQIAVIAPGVGIVSTLPNGAFGTMSGTSMACPAISGYAAFLLGRDKSILEASPAERRRKLTEGLYTACQAFGFGRDFEGFGMPR